MGPSRKPGIRHFRNFSIEPTRIEDGILEMETSDWYYSIWIVDQRDVNKDGIEDLLFVYMINQSSAPTELSTRIGLPGIRTDPISLRSPFRYPMKDARKANTLNPLNNV